MRQFTYAVRLTPDRAGGYVVTCRDLQEAITQGESIQEALTEAADCLEEAIAARPVLGSVPRVRRQLLQHVAEAAPGGVVPGGVAVCWPSWFTLRLVHAVSFAWGVPAIGNAVIK